LKEKHTAYSIIDVSRWFYYLDSVVPRLDMEEPVERNSTMTQIRAFVSNTTLDLRGGRHSWRVLSMLWSGALAVSVAVTLMH